MEAKQLSVFIENREGRLEDVLKVLKDNNINILSLSLADTSEYGLLRLIVNNPEVGKNALQEKGFSTMLTDVLVIRIDHKVGQLHELVYKLSKNNINLEYMYGLNVENKDASLVLKTSDINKAREILIKNGVQIVTASDIEKM
ncbi:MAG: amino acid-binding protein [Clostridia bacterium]